jgi:(E)-4-hydroxy-3-methylbut-2-enyl-diphosphate synthase
LGVTGASPKNLIYVDGKPDHKIESENLVDHLESLIREKINKQKDNQETLIAKSD